MYRGLPLRQGLKSYSGETKNVGKKTSLECHTPSDRLFLSDTQTSTVFWPRCFLGLPGKRASLRSQITYIVLVYVAISCSSCAYAIANAYTKIELRIQVGCFSAVIAADTRNSCIGQ
jgi:hypothetical protein